MFVECKIQVYERATGKQVYKVKLIMFYKHKL